MTTTQTDAVTFPLGLRRLGADPDLTDPYTTDPKTLVVLGAVEQSPAGNTLLRIGQGNLTDQTWQQTVHLVLTPAETGALIAALRASWVASQDSLILFNVLAHLARKFPRADARAVVFTPMEWDNGNFLTEVATVFFADGNSEASVDFDCGTALTEGYGAVGSNSGLALNVRTGETFFDDYIANVTERVSSWLV